MITTAAEYYSKLYDIQQSSSLKNDLRIPSWDYIKSYDGFNPKEKYYTDEKGTEEIKLTKENGRVSNYIQGLFVNMLRWRINSDMLLPYHLSGKDYDDQFNRIVNLVKKLDTKIILGNSMMDIYHKFYLIGLKNDNITIDYFNKKFHVIENGSIINSLKRFALRINKFKLNNNVLSINGYLRSVLFNFVTPKFYMKIVFKNGIKEIKEIDLYKSNHCFYKTKMNITNIYGFDFDIDISNVKMILFYSFAAGK